MNATIPTTMAMSKDPAIHQNRVPIMPLVTAAPGKRPSSLPSRPLAMTKTKNMTGNKRSYLDQEVSRARGGGKGSPSIKRIRRSIPA
jgi:hypothetical protein